MHHTTHATDPPPPAVRISSTKAARKKRRRGVRREIEKAKKAKMEEELQKAKKERETLEQKLKAAGRERDKAQEEGRREASKAKYCRQQQDLWRRQHDAVVEKLASSKKIVVELEEELDRTIKNLEDYEQSNLTIGRLKARQKSLKEDLRLAQLAQMAILDRKSRVNSLFK